MRPQAVPVLPTGKLCYNEINDSITEAHISCHECYVIGELVSNPDGFHMRPGCVCVSVCVCVYVIKEKKNGKPLRKVRETRDVRVKTKREEHGNEHTYSPLIDSIQRVQKVNERVKEVK